MTAHAKLSASGSHRWLNCPGSVAAEAKAPQSKGSYFADEGTAAHELADLCLTGALSPHDFEDKIINNIEVNREMADAVQHYIDFVRTVPGVHEYEQRVCFDDWVPAGFGTSDVISVDDNTIHIVDLKYGKGVMVHAEENSQMMLYALGAYSERSLLQDITHARMVIVQPRLDHISEWSIAIDDLLRWGEWVSQQAELALTPDAPRVPGEKQCHWCPAKAVCPALDAYTRKIIASDFDCMDAPASLPDDRLREVLEAKKLITGWLDAVEQHVVDTLESGKEFPGFKLVAGRSLRQWGDEDDAENLLRALLGDDAYTRKLISPTQAEKALGKAIAADIQPLIVKPEGKPTLAPASDKRPAVNITKDDFDALQ